MADFGEQQRGKGSVSWLVNQDHMHADLNLPIMVADRCLQWEEIDRKLCSLAQFFQI